MICTKCFNGFLCESFPVPFLLSYRGFQKCIGSQVFLECSLGCNNSTESTKSIITSGESLDVEMRRFKYEINRKLSGGCVQVEISKRKLESYRRAEALAQELRFQIANRQHEDGERLCDFVISWMRSTGKCKFDRPKKPRGSR